MSLLDRYFSSFGASALSRDPLDVGNALLLLASTVYGTKGLLPPHFADKTERHRRDTFAVSSDTGPAVARTLLIASSIFQGFSILRRNVEWSNKARAIHAGLCLLTAFGGWMRLRCYKELGRFFTFAISIRKEHKVIQSGPYRYMRHPSYTALAILVNAQLLLNLIANPVTKILPSRIVVGTNVFMFGVHAFLTALRILQEEEMLDEHFGQEYREYSKRTARLIPFIF